MTNKIYILITTVVLGAFVMGCQTGSNPVSATTKPATTPTSAPVPPATNTPPAASPATPTDDAPRITLAEAKKAFDDGSAIFVDTRTEAAFKQERIKGAVNIPVGSVAANVSKLSKGKKIIAYCS